MSTSLMSTPSMIISNISRLVYVYLHYIDLIYVDLLNVNLIDDHLEYLQVGLCRPHLCRSPLCRPPRWSSRMSPCWSTSTLSLVKLYLMFYNPYRSTQVLSSSVVHPTQTYDLPIKFCSCYLYSKIAEANILYVLKFLLHFFILVFN